jgi:hypothetical protein
VANSQEVEQGRGYSECRKANEDNCDHRVPHEGRVTPQSCHYIFAVNHCPTPEEHSQISERLYLLKDHPAHNLYVKKCVKSAASSHSSYEAVD